MMNKTKVINSFLEHMEQLSRLPLITNWEMSELFGEEVVTALMQLDHFNQEKEVCLHCESKCCQAIDCEFYAPQFNNCPIFDFRPVVCRLHFCHRFYISTTDSSLIKVLGDIFFDGLLAADRDGSSRIRLFDCPPLGRVAPKLTAVTTPWVNAVRQDNLSPEQAKELIYQAADKYRIADSVTEFSI